MKAEILYYTNTLPHPGQHKAWGKKHMEIHFGKAASISLSRGFFQKHWRKLPITENVSSIKNLDQLFGKYNQYTNPYANTVEGQRVIQELNTHTSMSVGDVIKVNGSHYMVAGHGYKKLFLTLDKRKK